MPFLRRHSNGFQVVIDRQSTAEGYLWVVYSVVEDGLIGEHPQAALIRQLN